MIALNETKNTVEINSLKAIALDWLGVTAARLRKDSLRVPESAKSLVEVDRFSLLVLRKS